MSITVELVADEFEAEFTFYISSAIGIEELATGTSPILLAAASAGFSFICTVESGSSFSFFCFFFAGISVERGKAIYMIPLLETENLRGEELLGERDKK
jgi:hypothetical protein